MMLCLSGLPYREIGIYTLTGTGAILQAKANEFAELLDEKGFVCSNGWLDRFKKRNINCGKIVGEAAGVCNSDVTYWMEHV
ncbi:hypothetical protein JTE90_025261 [Oedothorax gibbosus]|uniref:HTH CENPB-type domain-containing protein n=1 Tax=Oedothorax gibbosus TaxID=931172 RepID=A0AAV6U8H7_9ARAC|nr:hypothetical protein JTE90_025261 [Oedothorax gibbosus]